MNYLSVKQTATSLGVCEKTIRRMLNRNEMKSRRVGRLIRIPESELEVNTRVIKLRDPNG